ncbi:MAG: pitrilysin family protein [Planctomycetota bacterium]
MPTPLDHTFPNQLRLIGEPDPAAHTAAIGFFVNAGARDEDPAVMGVSHFLEHMMFKGTERRTADDVNREFDEIGANYNAFTSHEQTVYWAHVLPEMLDRATDLLADMLRPSLRTDDFDMEKNVILEEIGMYDDRPEWRLQDALLENYFRGHPLSHRVLGTADTIKPLTADQMRDYFTQRYAADNITIAAAGNFDPAQLTDALAERTAHWQPSGATRNHGTPPAHDASNTLTDDRVSRHYLALLTPAPSNQDDLRYAAKVFADVVGDQEGSRLYWALVEPGIAEEADLSFWPHDRAGAYMAGALCDKAAATQVEDKLIDTLTRALADEPPTDDEIERAKNKLATRMTLTGERPHGRMQSIGIQFLYRREVTPLADELANLRAVTRDDIANLNAAYPLTPRSILRLTPAEAAT